MLFPHKTHPEGCPKVKIFSLSSTIARGLKSIKDL
jgi:hypothetical protein